jgi:hypothetical protein
MRIYIEQHPNKEIRTFHTSENFANRTRVSLGKYAFSTPDKPYAKRLVAFADGVGRLKEVQEVGVHKNNVSVTRNPAYSWGEVEQAVIPKIEKFFKSAATVETQERAAWMDKPPREYASFDYAD